MKWVGYLGDCEKGRDKGRVRHREENRDNKWRIGEGTRARVEARKRIGRG